VIRESLPENGISLANNDFLRGEIESEGIITLGAEKKPPRKYIPELSR
jgi:hypothetical protein